jgi:hypothetical protein
LIPAADATEAVRARSTPVMRRVFFIVASRVLKARQGDAMSLILGRIFVPAITTFLMRIDASNRATRRG